MVWAVVCNKLGGPEHLDLIDTTVRGVRDGEVRISVYAAGVNFPDLLTIAGKYQIRSEAPFVPGMEAAGVITEAGNGVDPGVVGQRVMAWAWNGCFAEEVVVPFANTLPLPDAFSFLEGAAFMVATSTATNALMQRGQLLEGETLLVHGAGGGVGLAAVEVGKLLGATVIATASNADKLEMARRKGADHLINYAEDNFVQRVMQITGDKGADVVFDPVGGDVFDQSVRSVAWGGRLLVIGFASGRIPQLPANQVLLKCFSLVGVRALVHAQKKPDEGSTYKRWMLAQAEQGNLRPFISEVLPLQQFGEALKKIESRSALGRIVLKIRKV